MVRGFLAIELPEDVKAALGNVVDSLRREGIHGLRLVRPDGIHLTLKFLGNIAEDQVEAVISAGAGAAEASRPFNLELGKAGVFPPRGTPRVLWVGIEGALEELAALQQRVENAMAQLGFQREQRTFSPHLTVARLREEASPSDRRRAAEVLMATPLPTGLEIPARSLSLMRSTLLPGGAVYDCIKSIALGGDSLKGLR